MWEIINNPWAIHTFHERPTFLGLSQGSRREGTKINCHPKARTQHWKENQMLRHPWSLKYKNWSPGGNLMGEKHKLTKDSEVLVCILSFATNSLCHLRQTPWFFIFKKMVPCNLHPASISKSIYFNIINKHLEKPSDSSHTSW